MRVKICKLLYIKCLYLRTILNGVTSLNTNIDKARICLKAEKQLVLLRVTGDKPTFTFILTARNHRTNKPWQIQQHGGPHKSYCSVQSLHSLVFSYCLIRRLFQIPPLSLPCLKKQRNEVLRYAESRIVSTVSTVTYILQWYSGFILFHSKFTN